MEYFEQAHVAKSAASTKKEETVKKQLKQMLYGYKKSDNELIKSSMDLKIDSDDSSSVSGFSDLNLTVSSTSEAGDTTRATIGSQDDVDSILDDLNLDISPKITDLTLDSENEHRSFTEENISEDITSTSEPLYRNTDLHSPLQSGDDEEISLLSFSMKSMKSTESSQEFDPDGLLASKIHENLNKSKRSKKVKKRKLDKFEPNSEDVLSQKIKSSKKGKSQLSPPLMQYPSLAEEDLVSLDISLNKLLGDNSLTESSDLSPSYIAVNATEMEQENFDDVVGIYKHSIIKNIPYDNSELSFSENDSKFYSAKVITIDDNHMNEDIADLVDSTHDNIESQEMLVRDIESGPDIVIEDSIENVDDTQSDESVRITKNDLEDSIKLHFKQNLCVCVMKHPAKLFINGKFRVQCLGGTVEVFGYILADKPVEIYAPYSNFAQCLSSVEKVVTFYGLFSKLTKLGLTVSDTEEIVTTLGDHDVVLLIEPLTSVKMSYVERHFSVANLFSKSTKHLDNCHAKALERLQCSVYTSQPHKIFEIPISWQDINKYCFNEQSRGILCGGKSVGKSTCLRYQVNRLLPHGPVLVMDLDIGQSEFTVAGNISASVVNEPLLGPNFTHLRKPKRTLNLGMINPLDNMRRYVNAVVSLIAYCASDEQLKGMRWIVNTMGLCNVVGLHFITIIILHCQPTYLLQIDCKNVKKRFEMFLRPQLVMSHYENNKNMTLFANTTCPDNLNYGFIVSHHTETPVRSNNVIAPRDERYLNFLSYFSEVLQIHKSSTLLAVRPYEVQLQDLCVYMNVKIPEGTVQQVLNGKIVALCQHELGSVTEKTHVLADEPLLCHGHGLIRGIDYERGILYLITPMPIEELLVVDTLLYADWVPELRGQEVYLPTGIVVPYRMPTMYQQKQLMFTPRRRFNPVQLLKMSRGS